MLYGGAYLYADFLFGKGLHSPLYFESAQWDFKYAAKVYPFGYRYRVLLPVYYNKLRAAGYSVPDEMAIKEMRRYLAYDPLALDMRIQLIAVEQKNNFNIWPDLAALNKYKGYFFQVKQ